MRCDIRELIELPVGIDGGGGGALRVFPRCLGIGKRCLEFVVFLVERLG